MPEYLHPGVYVEEIERGPRPIDGVPTSIPAMIGATERGPVSARVVTSLAEYERLFGGEASPGFLPVAVRGFFENGGTQAVICRTTEPGVATWYADLGTHFAFAIGPGDWGSRVTLTVERGAKAGVRIMVAYFAADKPDPSPPQYSEIFEGIVTLEDLDEVSRLIAIRAKPDPSPDGITLRTGPLDRSVIETPAPQGLAVFDDEVCKDVSLLYSPDADVATQRALVAHCEQSRHRFAVLDAPRGIAAQDLRPRANIADSNRAALYWPWLWILDASGQRQLVPPGGHVLGIYARTDRERGVHKAPANEVVTGAIDLEFIIDEQAQDPLSLRGVDVIRQLPGRGIRVWGARTLSSDPQWKYVNVRRLFDYLEHSIDNGTQWVVFEPNAEPTWTRVRDVVTQFLRAQWQSGALSGATENQAFFVHCDRTTMTRDDIDNGRLICEIGIAPVKPAEFVIFRIQQKTAES